MDAEFIASLFLSIASLTTQIYMPNKIASIFIALFLITISVSANETPTIPAWLQNKIDEHESSSLISSPLTIYKTIYKGITAYYTSARCCDIPSQLHYENGSLICYPSGGFAGGDGKCPTFNFETVTKSILWRDKRKKVQ